MYTNIYETRILYEIILVRVLIQNYPKTPRTSTVVLCSKFTSWQCYYSKVITCLPDCWACYVKAWVEVTNAVTIAQIPMKYHYDRSAIDAIDVDSAFLRRSEIVTVLNSKNIDLP